ncbi:helix-turn-helix domain-containing protein [Enterococcus faecium]|uniref:helix-turn-helix domain-containing protein n=1 Tax=Enterococcus faecium TaxID=1352 RepID=UPI00191424DF|nr:helix-turn-helix transcriptional regulator [Enterococcus faecium]MBK5028072.1 helix-turn-helix transcriptional regulator [Enterococcus faecium]MBK5038816.1 helix-turn-helix transcriptional regulator [Enterococcus faecium]MBK5043889.1 helix-turn-helix transcriptional regulator [Enterococcus faecium]MBK5068811.1 helix-turn-helix transcriptional regulator [Enterococcus faecium]MBK5132119.1 helix-turn-helix transcriptional regulator [Enterococcus faecium]
MAQFNERIKIIRTEEGLTQREFAKLINVPERAYQYYESGARKPNLDKVIEIANKLNVSIDYLVGRTDKK